MVFYMFDRSKRKKSELNISLATLRSINDITVEN